MVYADLNPIRFTPSFEERIKPGIVLRNEVTPLDDM